MARKTNCHVTDALFIIGAGMVGGGLGLLFAPRSGRRTRRDIARFARSVSTGTAKAVQDFADDVSGFADTMGHKASKLLHEGRAMTRRSKERLLSAF